MISSVVTQNIKRSVGVYPRLVSYPAENITVLLWGKNATGGVHGTVIGSANTSFKVGETADTWDEQLSVDLDGSVTLRNA